MMTTTRGQSRRMMTMTMMTTVRMNLHGPRQDQRKKHKRMFLEQTTERSKKIASSNDCSRTLCSIVSLLRESCCIQEPHCIQQPYSSLLTGALLYTSCEASLDSPNRGCLRWFL